MNTEEPGARSGDLLRFDHVEAGYGKRRILRDLSFSIAAGDYTAIVGSNGSGKTTLLRTLLRILPPLSGRVTVDKGLHLGYVPQLQTVDEIFPLTVYEVVLMGRYGRLGALRRPGNADRERTMVALQEVGIEHLAPHLYRELSGGQKQRALIARALANDPDVLVLDEHTNDLDIASEKVIMALIDHLHEERHIAVVMVSHSLNTVANHAHQVGLITDGTCSFLPVEQVMQTDYLQRLYGLPLRVIEKGGIKMVV
jgi:ABC-type Mn2+/Zn2+ transport system ATPase subunit